MAALSTIKSRTGTIQYCSSPRSVAYAKARRESLSYKQVYIALIFGAICFSSWSLLSQRISSSLPSHVPSSSTWNGHSSSSSRGKSSRRLSNDEKFNIKKGPSSLLLAGVLQTSQNGSAPLAGPAVAPTTAGMRLAFQRTKTAMPFIMMTCRMCDDSTSIAIQEHKVYEPVTSTLVEHALSNSAERVYVEIGAGTGYFAMLASSWGSDVVAFEPNASARILLQHNSALHRDGRLKIVPYALGAKTTLAAVLKAQAAAKAAASGKNSTTNSNSSSTEAATSSITDSSSSGGEKAYGVDVLRLSDAISGDVSVTVMLINAPTLDGDSVPDVLAVAEGAADMLKHVQWLFLRGLKDTSSPTMRTMLGNILQHGNFSNVYCYGAPTPEQQEQDDAQLEPGQQQQQKPDPKAAGGVQYPADTHYVEVSSALQSKDAPSDFPHSDFLFTRQPLGTNLQINVPKPLVWSFGPSSSTAESNSTSSGGPAGSDGSSQQGSSSGEQLYVVVEETTNHTTTTKQS